MEELKFYNLNLSSGLIKTFVVLKHTKIGDFTTSLILHTYFNKNQQKCLVRLLQIDDLQKKHRDKITELTDFDKYKKEIEAIKENKNYNEYYTKNLLTLI